MITNIITEKKYIGLTTKTIKERFHKHYLNAMSGEDSYLYKSIRKYGFDNFKIKSIDSANNIDDLYYKEKFYIKKYNTKAPNGYNLTEGGSGGWIIQHLSEEKRKSYYMKRSKLTTFDKNPNFSGYSDDELIAKASVHFTKLGYIGGMRVWQKYAKSNKLPQTFSKNRFGGNYENFVKILQERTGLPYIKQKRTKKHI